MVRSKGTLALVVLLILAAFGGCMSVGTYNGLVSDEELLDEAWGNVETAYQRRADLIPNLVNTVKGASTFEQETLESVTQARAQATGITLSGADLTDPAKLQAFQAAQAQLGGALGRLLVVSENYPELRATDAFRDLQVQLEGTENRINVARGRYNEAVRGYNTRIRRFPTVLIAGLFGHDRRPFFEAEKGAEEAPTVDFTS